MSLRNLPTRLALLYLIIAGLWILLSDRALGLLISDPQAIARLQTVKGWAFVIVTALGLYLILRQESKRLQNAQDNLQAQSRLLQESEARFRKLFENAPIGIATARQQQIQYVNPAFLEMFGYLALEDVAGKSLLDMVAPEARKRLDDINKRREQGEVVTNSYQTIGLRKDSSTFLYHTFASVMEMPEGPTTIGFFIDQTELQRLSEERQAIINASPLPLYSIDTDGRVLMWNPAAEAEFGWTAEEALGQKLPIVQTEKMEEFDRLRSRVLVGDNLKGMEVTRLRKDGTAVELSLHTAPIRSPDGHIIGIMSAALNISEKIQTERALRQQTELLQTILDNAPVMIALINPEGQFIWVNQTWQSTLGFTFEEVQTRDIYQDLFPKSDDQQAGRDFVASAEGEWRDFHLTLPDGSEIDSIWAVVSLRDGNRISIGQDITQRKQSEVLIQQQAEQLEAIRQIGLELSSELDLDKLLYTIAERGIELLEGDGGGLMLHNPETDALEWVVRISPDGPLPEIALRRGEGLSGKVWVKGEPMWVSDYPTWEGRSPQYSQGYFHSIVIAPVRWGDEFLGVANIMSQKKGFFDAEHARLLDLFALQAAVAIKNARQYQAIETQRTQLRELTNKLVEIEEDERKRLAGMLHDQVGQTLAALSIQLNMLHSQSSAESQPAIAPFIEQSQKMLEEVGERIRDVMSELRPPVLEEFGLLAAIEWYGEQFTQRTGIGVEISGETIQPRLAQEVELTLFRVLQEALTNVAKHAHAARVQVELRQEPETVFLSIRDDGTGIQTGRLAASRPGHWGLRMMRERIQSLGGMIDIQNVPERGTYVNIAVQRREHVDSHPAGG